MSPQHIEAAKVRLVEVRAEALVEYRLCMRRLERMFPDAGVDFAEIIREYTGFSVHADFQFIRGRKKVIAQLAEVLRKYPDPSYEGYAQAAATIHRPTRVLNARRAFRVNATVGALMVRLMDYKNPMDKES